MGPIRCVRIRIRTIGMEKKRLNATEKEGTSLMAPYPRKKPVKKDVVDKAVVDATMRTVRISSCAVRDDVPKIEGKPSRIQG